MKKFFKIFAFILITLLIIPIIYALAHFVLFMFVFITASIIAASIVLYISEKVLK